MTKHKTPRYAAKLADLSSRPAHIKEAALLKAIVNGRQWEMDAVVDAIETNPYDWNNISKMDLFKHAAMFGRLALIKNLSEKFGLDKFKSAYSCAGELIEAFDAAIIHGHYDIGDFCLTLGVKSGYQKRGQGPQRAMYIAIEEGDLKKMTYLLDSAHAEPGNYFIYAACHGTPEVIDFLLGRGVDVNQKGSSKTPFVCALQYGRSDLARHLLAKGADPLLGGDDAMTYTIMANDIDMAATLIKRGLASTEDHIREAQRYNHDDMAALLKKSLMPKTKAPKP